MMKLFRQENVQIDFHKKNPNDKRQAKWIDQIIELFWKIYGKNNLECQDEFIMHVERTIRNPVVIPVKKKKESPS
eukprot:UN01992